MKKGITVLLSLVLLSRVYPQSYGTGIADSLEKSTLLKQISAFQYDHDYIDYAFRYDFNHDGEDDLLYFYRGSETGDIYCRILPLSQEKDILSVAGSYWAYVCPEFINYKGRQGIKVFRHEDGYHALRDSYTPVGEWVFYYYDRAQRRYVEDKSASNEELEKIQGSPDFFAEAGIDYRKLEWRLSAEDLEGFSKAALRIWRNAVYARRGRRFESEDLQALFSEYEWYKIDEEYSDDKLTEYADLWNIKFIQEYEGR